MHVIGKCITNQPWGFEQIQISEGDSSEPREAIDCSRLR